MNSWFGQYFSILICWHISKKSVAGKMVQLAAKMPSVSWCIPLLAVWYECNSWAHGSLLQQPRPHFHIHIPRSSKNLIWLYSACFHSTWFHSLCGLLPTWKGQLPILDPQFMLIQIQVEQYLFLISNVLRSKLGKPTTYQPVPCTQNKGEGSLCDKRKTKIKIFEMVKT